jgi:tRNA splicing endonuclease
MNNDQEPKTAVELAMERLAAKDRAEGVDAPKSLSEKQKKRITELRQEARAKVAEVDIFRDENIAAAAGDPEKLAEIESNYQIDRERIKDRMESAIREVKK